MDEPKSSVSALQEYCAKSKLGQPLYEYINDDESGYLCKVALLHMEAYGNGRSKRDAKHLGALNMMKKLPKVNSDSSLPMEVGDFTEEALDELTNMNRDMLKELRDYCVQQGMPMPTIEIVQQSGPPNAPQFVACCTISTIKRYGKSDKKKDARQRAAIEMLSVISKNIFVQDPDKMKLVPVNKSGNGHSNPIDCTDLEAAESERRQVFKTYREMSDAGVTELPNIKLRDRHNYFKSYFPELKEAAFNVLDSSDYATLRDKVLELLSVLKLTPRFSTFPSTSMEPIIQMELNCEYDCVLIAPETQIYQHVLAYFREMLT